MCKAILNDIDEASATVRGTLQKFLMKTVPRDISSQESYLILSKKRHHIHTSHSFRYISLTGNKSLNMNPQDGNVPIGSSAQNMAELYWARETNPHYQEAVQQYQENPDGWRAKFLKNFKTITTPMEMNLHEYVAFCNKNFTASKTEFIPRITPNYIYGAPRSSRKESFETFCRTMLLVNKPGATPDNLLDGPDGEKFEDFQAALLDFCNNSSICPSLIKEQYFNALKKGSADVDDENSVENQGIDEEEGFPEIYIPEDGKFNNCSQYFFQYYFGRHFNANYFSYHRTH